jgi:hypothetical protein
MKQKDTVAGNTKQSEKYDDKRNKKIGPLFLREPSTIL